jgi:hypothetical protein
MIYRFFTILNTVAGSIDHEPLLGMDGFLKEEFLPCLGAIVH